MRVKITIFQMSVFQLFKNLLYRRPQEHIAMRGEKLSHTESAENTEKSPRICAYLRVCFLATNGH